eukprot:CAMPEP_0115334244 /NCGR_PEP_ID=MMETSP0270-20121206/87803_1 /TAXON_ID=71861 /ORGANISM="Scrippsiella trochoidea, Strain CCMP3099" /LENGTH=95 /DNA_ID=CAMNT_0002755205 /DNA_START=50 /DNA_END=337 /DNA_ORIENTATION=+
MLLEGSICGPTDSAPSLSCSAGVAAAVRGGSVPAPETARCVCVRGCADEDEAESACAPEILEPDAGWGPPRSIVTFKLPKGRAGVLAPILDSTSA